MAVIRPAAPSDIVELTQLMSEYIVDFYKRPEPPMDRLHELIGLLLEQKEGIQFVAQCTDKLVGFSTLYFSYSTLRVQKIAIMNDLYVTESERGTGIAASIFAASHKYANEHECAYMSWVTDSNNKRAQRFYEKMGGTVLHWLNYSI